MQLITPLPTWMGSVRLSPKGKNRSVAFLLVQTGRIGIKSDRRGAQINGEG